MKETRLSSFFEFLNIFAKEGILCKHEVYLKTRLASSTVYNCFYIAERSKLLEGAGGDNIKQNYRLTNRGKQAHKILERIIMTD